MRLHSWKTAQVLFIGLLAVGLIFLLPPNAEAQEVGPSGCVKYCSDSSPSDLSEYGSFWRNLAAKRDRKRRERATAENNQCVALGNQGKWLEAEALCRSAVDLCFKTKARDCYIINDNLAWVGSEANRIRARDQQRQEAKRKSDALTKDFGRLIDSLNMDQNPGYSDPNVVDLTFLDPNKPIVLSPTKVKAGMDPLPTSRKAEMLLTALDEGAGDWEKSIKFLEDYLIQSPWDAEARDAYTYLLGMYRGYLARAEWANLYYRRGVWSWMTGDYDLAAANLAEAVVSNPDDVGARQLYAYVLGERDGSGYCENDICVHNDIETDPDLADFKIPPKLDFMDDPRMEALRQRVETNPDDLKARNLLHYLEGLAVYAQYEEPKQDPPSPEADVHVAEGLRLMVLDDYKGAASAFTEAHHFAPNNYNVIFALYYSLGAESGHQAGLGADAMKPWDKRLLDVMFEVLPAIADADLQAMVTGEDPNILMEKFGADKFGQEELAYIGKFMTEPVITVSADIPE